MCHFYLSAVHIHVVSISLVLETLRQSTIGITHFQLLTTPHPALLPAPTPPNT